MLRTGVADEGAAVFEGDDLITDGESESGAFSDRLGGIEGIKHARLDLSRDSAAVVLDRKSTRLNSSHITPSRMPSSA